MDESPPPSVTSPTSLDDFRRSSVGSMPRRETEPSGYQRAASLKFLQRGASGHASMSMGPNDIPTHAGPVAGAPMSAPSLSKPGSRRSFAFFGSKDRPPSSTGSSTQSSFMGGQPPFMSNKTGSGLSDSSMPEQSPASTGSQGSTMLSQSMAPSDSPANAILHSGYLTKRGHVITNWKTRFFALRSQGRLSYYNDEGMGKKLGEVHVSKVSPWSGETNGFMFQTTKQISYYVYASSNTERARWLKALDDFYIVPDPVDCEGYLTKRGHLVPSYRLRYFVMCGSVVKYYSDETAYRTGASALAEIEVKSGGRWDGESTGLFFKTATNSTMFVCAENVADLQKWIEALGRIFNEAPKPAPVACAGWLTKQGHKRKSWKKRYFVLRGTVLSYFADFEAANTRLGKALSEVSVKDVAPWDGEVCGFMFVTLENVPYYVFADNERDQAKWMTALKKAVGLDAPTLETPDEPEKKCPRCEYVLTGTRFCGACGFNLRGTSNERSKMAPPPVAVADEADDDENNAMDDLDALSEGARTLLLAVMQNPSVQIGGEGENAFAPRIGSTPSVETTTDAPPPPLSPEKPAPLVLATPEKPPTPEKPAEKPPAFVMRPPTPPKPSAAKRSNSDSEDEEESKEDFSKFRTATDSFASKQRKQAPRAINVPGPTTTTDTSFNSFGSDQAPARRISQPIPIDGPQPLGPSARKTVAQLLHEAESDEEEEKKEHDDDDASTGDKPGEGLSQFHLRGSARQFDTLPPNDDHDETAAVASPSSRHSDALVLDGVVGLDEETKPTPKLDLHTLMERELHCTPLFVPSAESPVRCRLYASMAYATSKKILVFLSDSGPLGVWHQNDNMNAALDEDHPFAMLSYLQRAVSEGYSVVVCNPFSNSAKVFEEGGRERIVPIPSSATPKEHVFFVWEKFLQPTSAEISVVAYQRGGSLAVALLEHFERCRTRLHRMAFVDSKHIVNRESTSAAVLEVLGRRTIQWEASKDQALGGQIVESQERVGCVCLSIGACDDLHVLQHAEDPVFAYLLANPPRPGMTAIVKQVRSVLRARRKTLNEKKPEMRNSNVFVLGEADTGNSDNMDEEPSPEKEMQVARQAPAAPTYYLPKQTAAAPKSKTQPHNLISMRDFELVKVVGQGGFGKVFLAKKVTDPHKDESYAMKVLKKQHVLSSGLVNTTMAERKILTEISHPFVVKLYYAFQSESKLYLVMDYLSGGSLALHLRRRRKFPEDWARFYGAEVAAAIAHLHHVNIIYRDAKLENVLMDHEGHVRITDFGLSKQGVSGLQGATTFCGTAAYIAPELLKGQTGPRGADEVLTHPFFDSIDWAELLAKRVPPPFNPGVGRLDTHFVAQNLNEITSQDRQVSMMHRNEHGPQRHNDFDGFSFVGRSNLNLDLS
ncbi:AGC protein kinase [Saprolegnia diclina VS20]|uniref:AGC protein kinase n=1 Tax=Saprolegnia diclina (strain VS20) TaxID=1156394 RepID=T0RBH3_SAPDV|nr:AGC protein kinase [Saprolegnia diclina VS20]EQC29513.1 AGC protein kinase [Saprolegnia diclina VS20]|eukprot:XP_008617065.1 AGC protein kinase [Saprolegnia diclina VS20]